MLSCTVLLKILHYAFGKEVTKGFSLSLTVIKWYTIFCPESVLLFSTEVFSPLY